MVFFCCRISMPIASKGTGHHHPLVIEASHLPHLWLWTSVLLLFSCSAKCYCYLNCRSIAPVRRQRILTNRALILTTTLPLLLNDTAWHHVISTNCAPLFRSFLALLLSVPLFKVIWSYPEHGYNLTGPSPGTVFHWTFVQHLHYQRSKTC